MLPSLLLGLVACGGAAPPVTAPRVPSAPALIKPALGTPLQVQSMAGRFPNAQGHLLTLKAASFWDGWADIELQTDVNGNFRLNLPAVELLPIPADDMLLTKYASIARMVGYDCASGSLNISNLYAKAVAFQGFKVFDGDTHIGGAVYGYSSDGFKNDTVGDRSVLYVYVDGDVNIQGSAGCQPEVTYNLALQKGWNTVTMKRVHPYGDNSTSLGYDVYSGVDAGDDWVYFDFR